jgi:hypothetical protein
MLTARSGGLHLRSFTAGRALFTQDLPGRVLALAASRANTKALAQVGQGAPKPDTVANLAFSYRIADADVHFEKPVEYR